MVAQTTFNLDSIAILWSPTQQAFHREMLAETVLNGMNAFLGATPLDFILIGIFGTKEESDRALEFFNEIRAHRIALASPSEIPNNPQEET